MHYIPTPQEQMDQQRAMYRDQQTVPAQDIQPETVEGGPNWVKRASARRSGAISRAGQVIYVLLGLLDALLLIRFVLRMLGANPEAAFTSFMYGVTQVFVVPFEGVFPSPASNGSVIEMATLLAIIVYALLAWLVVNLVDAMTSRFTRSM